MGPKDIRPILGILHNVNPRGWRFKIPPSGKPRSPPPTSRWGSCFYFPAEKSFPPWWFKPWPFWDGDLWPFQGVKWPPTRGWKGHFESPGPWILLLLCFFVVEKSTGVVCLFVVVFFQRGKINTSNILKQVFVLFVAGWDVFFHLSWVKYLASHCSHDKIKFWI